MAQEFNVSIPNAAISRMRAAASWTERAEMRLLADPPKVTRISQLLLALLDFRRRPGCQPIDRACPARLPEKPDGGGPNHACAYCRSQIILGRPGWLRRIFGRDRYRILPDPDRLPKVGDTLKLGGPEFDETALITGWSTPEPTGRWTCGHEATVAWCVRGQDQDLTLLIDGIPALHEKAPLQRIDVGQAPE